MIDTTIGHGPACTSDRMYFLTFDTYRCEWDVDFSKELDKIVTGSKRFLHKFR